MKKRYIIIPVVIAAVVGIGVCVAVQVNAAMSAMNAMNGVSTEVAERQDLKNYITASGTIESSDVNKVYSDLVYAVETVNAKVGDVVKKGDVLCTIDTELLRQKIDEQEAAINTSDQNTGYNITDAEKAYNDALADYQNNENTQIISAKNALDNAETALTAAKKAYDDAVKTKGTTDDSSLESAKLSLESAKTGLSTAEKNVLTAKENLQEALDNQKDEDYYSIKQVSDAYKDAKELRDDARSDKATREIDEAKEAYQRALEIYMAYQQDSTNMPVGTTLSDYAAAASTAKQQIATLTAKYDIKTCEENLAKAKEAYDEAKEQVDKANENAIEQAENAVEQAENAVVSAKRQIESAELQLRATTKGNTDQIDSLQTQLENAETAVSKAKNSYDLTVQTVEANLETLKTQAQRARDRSDNTSAQVALENLYDQLEEATITSPCDGVVTYENVAEGIAPTGVLFVIEDPNDLIINVAISEYDMPDVSTDLKCEIVPNAMTDLTYNGIIESIAPAATKAATGDDAGTGSFKATVAVTSTDTKLLIGMTARVNIILEEAKDVLSVSSDIIGHDDGGDYVFTAIKVETPATAQTGGLVSVYTAKKVYVTLGLETSFYVEITPVTAGEIEAGTILLTRPQGITDGQTISVMDQDILAAAMGGAGGNAQMQAGMGGGPGGGGGPAPIM